MIKKRIINVAVAGFAAALLLSGCSEKEESSSAVQTNSAKGTVNVSTDSGDTSQTAQTQTNPLEAAKDVARTYLKAANAEYSETMNYLMTEDYAEKYKEEQENMGHDHTEHSDDSEQYSDVNIEFGTDCALTDSVRIDSLYTNAAELYAEISYTMNGEAHFEDTFLLAVEIGGQWKICFEGTKTLAYTEGILADNKSSDAALNARTVYEAAVAVYITMQSDKDYKFDYVNYISTENDKFINKIKENIPEELRNSFFTVLLDKKGVTHVIWSESASDEVNVIYPES